jgi:hypothetical protein
LVANALRTTRSTLVDRSSPEDDAIMESPKAQEQGGGYNFA